MSTRAKAKKSELREGSQADPLRSQEEGCGLSPQVRRRSETCTPETLIETMVFNIYALLYMGCSLLWVKGCLLIQ